MASLKDDYVTAYVKRFWWTLAMIIVTVLLLRFMRTMLVAESKYIRAGILPVVDDDQIPEKSRCARCKK